MEKKNILIADRDSKFMLKAIDTLIEKYELYVAFSLHEVYKKINVKIPDLIILGYLEPLFDSYTLQSECRNNIITNRISFLIIDSKTQDDTLSSKNKKERPKIPAQGYLPRSVSSHELYEEVDRIINLSMPKKKDLSDSYEFTRMVRMPSIHYLGNQNSVG